MGAPGSVLFVGLCWALFFVSPVENSAGGHRSLSGEVSSKLIETSLTGRLAVLTLAGEFDVANCDQIRAVTADLVGSGVTDITMDFSQVTFVDAAAIGSVVAADNLLAEIGGRMLLVGLSGPSAKAFTISGAAGALPVLILSGPGPTPAQSPQVRSDFESPEGLRAQLYDLSQRLLVQETLTANLREVAHAAVRTVRGCDTASVALLAVGQSRTGVGASQVAIEVDVAQYRTGEGPCLDAAQTGRPIRLDVFDPGESYVHFAPLAVEAGVNAILSVPIVFEGEAIGSLNLYSTTRGAFDPEAETVGTVLAAQAAAAVGGSSLYGSVRRLAEGAQRHSDDRADFAAGDVLTVLRNDSLRQAEELLTSTAGANYQSLSQAARHILAGIGQSAGRPDDPDQP